MIHKLMVAVLLLAVIMAVPAQAATQLVTYGQIVSVTPVYGTGGLVNNYQVLILNLDTTGYYTYVCRRPNLGPCANMMVGNSYRIDANLMNSCSSLFICGEGLIASVSPI